jgi:hypothetical protein
MADDEGMPVLRLDADRIEVELSRRLHELGGLAPESQVHAHVATVGVMHRLLADHEGVEDRCRTCNTLFPCPAVNAMSRMARLPEVLNARAIANAVAEEAKAQGANVLTVLRRPELDVFAESSVDWDERREELFGFEVVLPDTAVVLRIPGGPRPHGRREYDQDDAVKQVRKAGVRS